MRLTLEPDQYVLVDKLTPHFDDYSRGDIIVFNPPPTDASDPAHRRACPFIKRVIGEPGDLVEIATAGLSTASARRAVRLLRADTRAGDQASWTSRPTGCS
jgi:signal peptidase I